MNEYQMASSKIWLTGHNGMVGSSTFANLKSAGANVCVASSSELDLTNQKQVKDFAESERPDLVIHVAAKVGGILANKESPADFIYQNLMIQTNVINSSFNVGVKKLIFVASNCTYPSDAPNPISEDKLLTGMPDKNVISYGVSKIAGIEMCDAFNRQHGTNYISVIPPNLFGKGDNYHPTQSHVVAGLIRRIHEAKVNDSEAVFVWGDGTARRELLFVDELANAIVFLASNNEASGLYNVGADLDHSIKEIAELIKSIVGYKGELKFDPSKPAGTKQKLLDSARIHRLGWTSRFNLRECLEISYADYLERKASFIV